MSRRALASILALGAVLALAVPATAGTAGPQIVDACGTVVEPNEVGFVATPAQDICDGTLTASGEGDDAALDVTLRVRGDVEANDVGASAWSVSWSAGGCSDQVVVEGAGGPLGTSRAFLRSGCEDRTEKCKGVMAVVAWALSRTGGSTVCEEYYPGPTTTTSLPADAVTVDGDTVTWRLRAGVVPASFLARNEPGDLVRGAAAVTWHKLGTQDGGLYDVADLGLSSGDFRL